MRDRNRARFLIRSFVAAECTEDSHGGSRTTSSALLLDPSPHSVTVAPSASEKKNDETANGNDGIIKELFKAVGNGNTSYFSLKLIAENYHTIVSPQSYEYTSKHKVTTLCRSRFGEEYLDAALFYRENKGHFTMMEYASIIGEYGIVGSLISGGIHPLPVESLLFGSLERREQVSKLVLKNLIASMVPKTLAIYVIQSLFVMKMWSFYSNRSEVPLENKVCPICKDLSPLISFKGDCHHSCCELCHWEVTVTQLNGRHDGDVVQCPVCSSYHSDSPSDPTSDDNDQPDPIQRCQISLEKFNALPENGREFRKIQRPPKKKNVIHSSWNAALEGSCGKSKDVRKDKFMKYVNAGAVHHCRACLRAGVHINDSNEYNQTALYIATWRNHFKIVQLLLEWGADPNLAANGNLSVINVARAHGFYDIVELLREYGASDECSSLSSRINNLSKTSIDVVQKQKLPSVIALIQPSVDHPGAGSYYIDDAVSEDFLKFLVELHLDTPVADDCDIKKKKKSRVCSLRHNFCDSEGAICNVLATCIESSLHKSASIVFPAMRFLHYDTPGSVLPPHVDLTKIDALTQKRSTHTFILYLHDCEHGGETALLQELSPDGPLAKHEVIAQVKPRRGRLLLFPHACPHEGKEVVSVPKLLLRGEVLIA